MLIARFYKERQGRGVHCEYARLTRIVSQRHTKLTKAPIGRTPTGAELSIRGEIDFDDARLLAEGGLLIVAEMAAPPVAV